MVESVEECIENFLQLFLLKMLWMGGSGPMGAKFE